MLGRPQGFEIALPADEVLAAAVHADKVLVRYATRPEAGDRSEWYAVLDVSRRQVVPVYNATARETVTTWRPPGNDWHSHLAVTPTGFAIAGVDPLRGPTRTLIDCAR